VVIPIEELEKFELTQANPMNLKIRDFMPKVKAGEAKEFVTRALDWYNSMHLNEEIKRVILNKSLSQLKYWINLIRIFLHV